MNEKVQVLEAAYNAYVEALADVCEELKAQGYTGDDSPSLAKRAGLLKYLLDNHIDIASVITPARTLFMACASDRLLERKVM